MAKADALSRAFHLAFTATPFTSRLVLLPNQTDRPLNSTGASTPVASNVVLLSADAAPSQPITSPCHSPRRSQRRHRPSLRYHPPSASSPPPPPPSLATAPLPPRPIRRRPRTSPRLSPARATSPTCRAAARAAGRTCCSTWALVGSECAGRRLRRLFPLQLASFLPPPPLLPALPSLPLRCRGYAGGQRTL